MRRTEAQTRVETQADRPLRDALADALARHNGEQSAVAREFGVDPATVSRWCRRYGVRVVRRSLVMIEGA
jgi:transcriptional regulator with GAF, ATPase, and Fis domain